VAGDLFTQYQAVLQGSVSATQGLGTLLRLLDDFANRCVEEEKARLRSIYDCNTIMRDACLLFGRRLLSERKSCAIAKQKVARAWLATVGHNIKDALEMCRPLLQKMNEMVSAVESSKYLDDDDAARLYSCMAANHDGLATSLALEMRRLNWLLSAPIDSPCWSGLVVVADSCDHAFDERILTPPSHLGAFATGRLRVSADPKSLHTAFSCGLATVRVARLLVHLLRDSHLPVDQLGVTFANRIVVYEFAKYEHATLRIEDETLVPFGELVSVPYKCGAVSAALSDEEEGS
jgi:hypothetical protein